MIIAPFVLGVLVAIIDCITTVSKAYKAEGSPETVEYIESDPVTEERKENLDRQLDGYNQLLQSLDRQLATETDEKKRAAILSKQLTTLEKYNKTMEKRRKMGD